MSGNVYSFLDINASIVGPGGIISLGSGAAVSEEGITIAPTGPINGMQVGADGEGQHSLYADRSGTVVVRLLKTSPTNRLLMNLYNFQTASASTHGQNTFVLNDSSRGDVVAATQCAFQKVPDMAFAKDAGFFEWEFAAIKINRTLGS